MSETPLQLLVSECLYTLYKSHREMLPDRPKEYFRDYHSRWASFEEIFELNNLLKGEVK